MALKIELNKKVLTSALEDKIKSIKRSVTNETNELIKEIKDKEITSIRTAIETITETK